MTLERKFVVGLDDIKGISYECNNCHARLTFPIGRELEPHTACYSCGHRWRAEIPRHQMQAPPSAYVLLLGSAKTIMELQKEAGFRLVLEFDEPSREGV